jgi:hypothetical protein
MFSPLGTVKRSAFVQVRPMRRFSEDHQMKDEALKLALEALETELAVDMTNGAEVGEAAELMCEAITAIKQALAADVQEPVAWMFQHGETGRMNYLSNDGMNSPSTFVEMNPRYALVCPLYTTPPAQPAVPDAFGTREGEHPQYVQGWNDCRQTMLEILKARTA